jgi:hypothetical protein
MKLVLRFTCVWPEFAREVPAAQRFLQLREVLLAQDADVVVVPVSLGWRRARTLAARLGLTRAGADELVAPNAELFVRSPIDYRIVEPPELGNPRVLPACQRAVYEIHRAGGRPLARVALYYSRMHVHGRRVPMKLVEAEARLGARWLVNQLQWEDPDTSIVVVGRDWAPGARAASSTGMELHGERLADDAVHPQGTLAYAFPDRASTARVVASCGDFTTVELTIGPSPGLRHNFSWIHREPPTSTRARLEQPAPVLTAAGRTS